MSNGDQQNQSPMMPNDPNEIRQHIDQLKGHLSQLEQGQASHMDIGKNLGSSSSPFMQMVGQGLQKLENSQQAQDFIRSQISNLEKHLTNL